MGRITAQEAIAIGLNWLLAPVVDVNNNADNPVINVRAFGATPERVSQLSGAFIQGAQEWPVLTTAKHFPGHGDTAVDSHLHLPEIPHDVARLEQVELAPFRAAIAQQVDAVMTAHLRLPAYDDITARDVISGDSDGTAAARFGISGADCDGCADYGGDRGSLWPL
jgi:beta-glucosidase